MAVFVNLNRYKQAVALLPRLQQETERCGISPDGRDHTLHHAHCVLQYLGRCMARAPKPGVRRNPKTVTDTCFPSIDRIAADTTLSDKTVRRALGYLVQWGLITKSILPHHKPMIGRHPERYYGRRYHVVAEVWDAAESEAAVPTVEMAQPSPEDLATLDRLDDPIVRTSTSPVPVPTVVAPVTNHSLTAVQQRMFTGIAALLRERLAVTPPISTRTLARL